MTMLDIGKNFALPVDWMLLATVVYGARGSGKTTLAAVIVEEVHAAGHRVCIIDLKGDYWGLRASADGKGEGIPVVIFGGDHADLPLAVEQAETIGSLVAELEQSVVLDLEHLRKAEQVVFLARFFETLYEKNRQPLLCVLDEVQRYAPQKPMSKEAQRCLGAVEDLVKLGRKHGLGVLAITQRGAGMSKEVSEVCDVLIACRTPGVLDQERISTWMKTNVSAERVAATMGPLAALPTGQIILASAHPDVDVETAGGNRHGGQLGIARVEVRRRTTFDSSPTPKVGVRRHPPERMAKPNIEAVRSRLGLITNEQSVAQASPRKGPQEATAGAEVEVVKQELARVRDRCAHLLRMVERDLGGIVAQVHEELKLLSPSADPEALTLVDIKVKNMGLVGKIPRMPSDAPPAKGRMTPGEQMILTALIQYPKGLTREQLTVMTMYKRSSRDTYLAKLKVRGFIEGAGDRALVTEAGKKAMPHAKPLPTGRKLREWVMSELPQGERNVLQALLDAHPYAMQRDEIDKVTGYRRSSRDTYLSKLQARELVFRDDASGGAWRPSRTLFDGMGGLSR